ncbi:MAG TPA: DUF3788 family protein [Gemmatimonadales bacterium]|jgi:hypothetical protein
MSRGRSNAYWSGNPYSDPETEPAPGAPLKDLPPVVAERFRVLRSGLVSFEGVGETVRYMGESWRWAWEYGVGNRKLCWVHVVGTQISVTFTLSDGEDDRLSHGAKMASAIVRAIAEGQRTGPVKWCWLELDDRRTVDAFLRLAGRKAEWLGERPRPQRSPRARPRRPAGDD